MRGVSWAIAALAPLLVGQPRDLYVSADPSRRVALVMGNDDYRHAPKLHNAANDADDLARALSGIGFDVDRVTNVDLRAMEAAIHGFVTKLRPGDVAFFHFSGHGIQIDGENYLVPVDFRLTDEASVKYDAYSASKLHDRIAGSGSRLNIVVLDACRNNGFRATRSAGAGLAAMHAAEGSFIAFSTSPGDTADDNPEGRNGLFSSHLLEVLRQPGLNLDQVFNEVREKVYTASGKRQLPWSSSSVMGEFVFRPAVAEEAPGPSGDAALAVELTYWNSIKDSSNPTVFEAYLTEYPAGKFATLAKIRLGEFGERVSAPKPPRQAFTRPVAPAPVMVEAAPATVREAQEPGTVGVSQGDGLRSVWIPAGAFQMGCGSAGRCEDDERPVHEVTIGHGFWMTQAEVSVGAYERFARATGRSMPPAPNFNREWRKKDHPMVAATWAEAEAFCVWSGGRLPSEAEWEYAARAGKANAASAEADVVAWHAGNSGSGTHEVGSRAPNVWGLFDMLGNAAEWCGDWYGESYGIGPRADPRGPQGGRARVVRGGSWETNGKELRVADRSRLLPGMRNRNVGFRCVKRAN